MNCIESKLKKYTSRKSPPFPANECPEGMIKTGNDGLLYIIVKSSNGINRWVKYSQNSKPIDKVQTLKYQIPKIKTSHKPNNVSKQQSKIDYSKLTIPKIKQHLNKLGIIYKKSLKKEELLALIPKKTKQSPKIKTSH